MVGQILVTAGLDPATKPWSSYHWSLFSIVSAPSLKVKLRCALSKPPTMYIPTLSYQASIASNPSIPRARIKLPLLKKHLQKVECHCLADVTVSLGATQ